MTSGTSLPPAAPAVPTERSAEAVNAPQLNRREGMAASSTRNAQPRLRQADATEAQSMRLTLRNGARRHWIRAQPRIHATWHTFRNKIDHGVDLALSKIEHGLHLKPHTIKRSRLMTASILSRLGHLANVTGVALFCAAFACPPVSVAILPLFMAAFGASMVSNALARSMAHNVLYSLNEKNASNQALMDAALYMSIIKQPYVRIHNTPIPKSKLLIQLFDRLTNCIEEEKNAQSSNNKTLKQLEASRDAIEKQLHTLLYRRAQSYNISHYFKSKPVSAKEVDPCTLWRPIRFNNDEIIPTARQSKRQSKGTQKKGVIDYLESDLYSEYATRKERVDILEKIIVRPMKCASDYVDLLRLRNQMETSNQTTISAPLLLSEEEKQRLAKRQIGLQEVEPILAMSTQEIALRALNALTMNQIKDLVSRTATDGVALKAEAAFRNHVYNHPELYRFEERGDALTKALREKTIKELIDRTVLVQT